jgi:hypothetical protein
MRRCCRLHSLQSDVPGLLRLLHLILATFCKLSLALQMERGSMTRRCALPSHCVLAPRCALHTPVSAATQSTVPGSTAWSIASRPDVTCATNAVNDLTKRALTSANIPAILEPHSLCRDDGKRPDVMTVLPWTSGRCIVWDFTCPNTLAASHLNYAVVGPGAVANPAESRKTMKYNALSPLYRFVPVAVETLGQFTPVPRFKSNGGPGPPG